MENRKLYVSLLLKELQLYTEARAKKDHDSCYKHLSRAHIISQARWFHHLYIHFLMFEYSYRRKDFKEFGSQFLRLIVTVPGHLLGKVPRGNIGWGTVGLTEVMPLPEDLRKQIEK